MRSTTLFTKLALNAVGRTPSGLLRTKYIVLPGIQHPSLPSLLMSSSAIGNKIKLQDTTSELFQTILPDIISDLSFENKDIPLVGKHIEKCLKYNLANGKMIRGLSVPISYKFLMPDEKHTPEIIRSANILGWCIEILHAFFLVVDDVMDDSTTRRGHLCWYKKDGVGLMALNDALLMESCIYSILQKHFSSHKQYTTIVEAFLKTTRRTCKGQALDMMSQVCGNGSRAHSMASMFDMKLYNNIVKYKTSYYTFCLPVQMGMTLADIQDSVFLHQSLNILLEIGKLFQVQDDFLDCFGDTVITGKVGSDIQDGKCTWLIIQALQKASEGQREQLMKHYGNSNKEDVEVVKQIYEELNLPKEFHCFEEESYDSILDLIGKISSTSRHYNPEVFHFFLNLIYKREK